MDAARPSHPLKLLSLQETAQRLAVSIDTLLLWNDHHILTPKITKDGTVGYSEEQIVYFQSIQQSFNKPTLQQELSVSSQSSTFTPRQISSILPQNNTVKTKNHFDFSQILLGLGMVIPIAFILFFIKGPMVTYFLNQLLQYQVSTDNFVNGQTSRLAFVPANSLSGPVHFRQEDTNGNLQNSGKNTTFSFLWEQKNEKTKSSTQSSQVLAARTVNLEKSGVANGSTSAKLAAVAAAVTANDASTLSPISTANSNSFQLDLGTLNTTNTIKNNTLATTAGVGILAVMLFVLESQLAVFGKRPQKAHVYPSVHKNEEEHIIELEQKMDGSVVALFQSKEYKICKPELYSDSDQLIERLMELTSTDEKEIEYDSFTDARLRLSTPLSRIVTRLNFVGLKRDLFFPRTSKNRVLFRRYITYQDLMTMNLTVNNVLSDLTKVA